MDGYAPEVERMMRRLFDSLKESDRRRYAAIEAAKLGHGGIEYIADRPGVRSQDHPAGPGGAGGRGRPGHRPLAQKGGGRKRLIETDPAIEANFHKVLEDHTAGDPMRLEVKWTNLSRRQIAKRIDRAGDPGQSRRRLAVAPQAPIPQAEGVEEEDDGAPSSGPQRPVREHRPAQEEVPEGRPAGDQHRHEEEGVARATSTATG